METDLKEMLTSIESEISNVDGNVDWVDRHVKETNEKLDAIINLLKDINRKL